MYIFRSFFLFDTTINIVIHTFGFYMFVPWIIAKDSSSATLMLS